MLWSLTKALDRWKLVTNKCTTIGKLVGIWALSYFRGELLTLYPSHQSIYHLFAFIISTRWALWNGRTHVTHVGALCGLAHHESPVTRWSLEVSGGSWVRLPLGAQKILFLSISTWERSSLFTLYPSHQSTSDSVWQPYQAPLSSSKYSALLVVFSTVLVFGNMIKLTNWHQFFMRLSCYWSWISLSLCQTSCGSTRR